MKDIELVIITAVFTTLGTLIVVATCKWYMEQFALMLIRNSKRNPVHHEIRQREKI